MTAAADVWAPLVRAWFERGPSIPDRAVSTILGIIEVESGGNPQAINPDTKATGLMQVMPRDAKVHPEYFADRPTSVALIDPDVNIQWGIKIWTGYLETCGTPERATVAYFTGRCDALDATDATGTSARHYLELTQATAQNYRQFDFPPHGSATTAVEVPQPQLGPPSSLLGVLYEQVAALTKVVQQQQATIQRLQEKVTAQGETILTLRRGAAVMASREGPL